MSFLDNAVLVVVDLRLSTWAARRRSAGQGVGSRIFLARRATESKSCLGRFAFLLSLLVHSKLPPLPPFLFQPTVKMENDQVGTRTGHLNTHLLSTHLARLGWPTGQEEKGLGRALYGAARGTHDRVSCCIGGSGNWMGGLVRG